MKDLPNNLHDHLGSQRRKRKDQCEKDEAPNTKDTKKISIIQRMHDNSLYTFQIEYRFLVALVYLFMLIFTVIFFILHNLISFFLSKYRKEKKPPLWSDYLTHDTYNNFVG